MFRLDDCMSIFSSEIFAILKTTDVGRDLASTREVIICADSKSSFQSISQIYSTNPLVNKIRHNIPNASGRISFLWTSSHVCISGNERADLAAIQALDLPQITH